MYIYMEYIDTTILKFVFRDLSRFPMIPRDLMLRLFYIIVILLLFAYYETRNLTSGFRQKKRVTVEKASETTEVGTDRTRSEITEKQRGAAQRDMMRNGGNIKQRRERVENNTKLRKNERNGIETEITPGHSF